jgi:hypothetical protein
MNLDLDGILKVTAIEKLTGLSKDITIHGALEQKTEIDLAAARAELHDLYASRESALHQELDAEAERPSPRGGEPAATPVRRETATGREPGGGAVRAEAEQVLARCRSLLETMHEEDRAEAVEIQETIERALQSGDEETLVEALAELSDLLFFVEGR